MTLSFLLDLLALIVGFVAVVIPEPYRVRGLAVGIVLLALADMLGGIKLTG